MHFDSAQSKFTYKLVGSNLLVSLINGQNSVPQQLFYPSATNTVQAIPPKLQLSAFHYFKVHIPYNSYLFNTTKCWLFDHWPYKCVALTFKILFSSRGGVSKLIEGVMWCWKQLEGITCDAGSKLKVLHVMLEASWKYHMWCWKQVEGVTCDAGSKLKESHVMLEATWRCHMWYWKQRLLEVNDNTYFRCLDLSKQDHQCKASSVECVCSADGRHLRCHAS